MPKVKVHPHPTLPIRCADCKFWHPDYIDDFVIQPQTGQAVTMKAAIANGMGLVNALTERRSICFFSVPWSQVGEDLYCAHWEGKPKR
jgi:hypothetical protein